MLILGLMSGTSLDGLDMALCDIDDGGYRMLAADTVPYPAAWRERLATLEYATALEYAIADVELGHYFGRCVKAFLSKFKIQNSELVVASHGHTIFHQPDKGLTTQIGNGDAIAAETGLPVVYGFRTLDVALGGQGAPLVPIGDELLFGSYDACLNLGGIANISYRCDGRRVAFDICPCNMILNHLAGKLGLEYDRDGESAGRGRADHGLLERLGSLDYYRQQPPKSLGKEWFVEHFRPLFDSSSLEVCDLLATAVEHIADEIAAVVNGNGIHTLLATGGGALNKHLIERLRAKTSCEVTVPDLLTVNYKEAIVFAYLGYLRLNHRVNTLASVTGAVDDSIGGSVSGLTKPMTFRLQSR